MEPLVRIAVALEGLLEIGKEQQVWAREAKAEMEARAAKFEADRALKEALRDPDAPPPGSQAEGFLTGLNLELLNKALRRAAGEE